MRTRTFLWLIPLSCSAFGQAPLTLQQAIQTGLQNNYGIRLARNEATIDANNNTAGNAGFLPILDLVGEYGGSLNNTEQQFVTGTEISSSGAGTSSWSVGPVIRWTVFDGLEMFITKDQLELNEESGRIRLKRQMELTVRDITVAYYDILLKQYLLSTFIEQKGISEFRRNYLQTRYDVGSAAEVELLKATVDLNADQYLVTTQETSVEQAKIFLNRLLSRDVNTPFAVDTVLPEFPEYQYEQLVQQLLQYNKDLQLAGQQVRYDALETKRMNAPYYPVLALNGGYSFLKSSSEAGFLTSSQNQSFFYGATLGWNLFDGMNTRREKQNAVIRHESSAIVQEDLQLDATARLRQEFLEYQNNLQLVELEQNNLRYAQKTLEIGQERFRLGALSDLELREIQRNLTEARVRLAIAAFNGKLSEVELLQLSGQLIQ